MNESSPEMSVPRTMAAAAGLCPARISSTPSSMAVENVVKPPKNPVVTARRTPGSLVARADVAAPKRKQPTTFTAKVPQGSAGKLRRTRPSKLARHTAPMPPARAITIMTFARANRCPPRGLVVLLFHVAVVLPLAFRLALSRRFAGSMAMFLGRLWLPERALPTR